MGQPDPAKALMNGQLWTALFFILFHSIAPSLGYSSLLDPFGSGSVGWVCWDEPSFMGFYWEHCRWNSSRVYSDMFRLTQVRWGCNFWGHLNEHRFTRINVRTWPHGRFLWLSLDFRRSVLFVVSSTRTLQTDGLLPGDRRRRVSFFFFHFLFAMSFIAGSEGT